MASEKKCSPITFPIPNTPQDKPANPDGLSVPNTLKITVEHDDGGSSMWGGIRKRGIKVRFTEVERYPDSVFETIMIQPGTKHGCSFLAVALDRHNAKRLQAVDKAIKAEAQTLANDWFRGERELIAQRIAEILAQK